MKSTTITPNPKDNALKFLVLMEFCGSDVEKTGMFVVLFSNATNGTVVHSKNTTRPLGMVAEFTIAANSKIWKKCEHAILLEND